MSTKAGYTVARWEDLPRYPGATGDLRVFTNKLNPEHLAMSVGRFRPGEGVEHHNHEEAEEIYYLLKGRSQIIIGDERIEAKEGTAFCFPPETMRSVYNNSEDECWWLFVGSPADEFKNTPDSD